MSEEPLPQPPQRSKETVEPELFEPIYAGLKDSSADPEPPREDDFGANLEPAVGTPITGLEPLPAPRASLGGVCGILALLAFLIALGSLVFLRFGE